MAAVVHEQVVMCPVCGKHETMLFRGRNPISNLKWRRGRGARVYHCGCPCHTLNLN